VTSTIVSDPTGFQLIDFLSPHTKFNETYYVTNILCPFAVWRDIQVRKTDRKLIIHSENARPHTDKKTLDFLELNGMDRAPHPPYSPDLAPCDFYIFGYIKQVLTGREFAERMGFLEAVMAILDAIPWRKYFVTE
jgi:histone-lysine N-methyltransferase SETMAR